MWEPCLVKFELGPISSLSRVEVRFVLVNTQFSVAVCGQNNHEVCRLLLIVHIYAQEFHFRTKKDDCFNQLH